MLQASFNAVSASLSQQQLCLHCRPRGKYDIIFLAAFDSRVESTAERDSHLNLERRETLSAWSMRSDIFQGGSNGFKKLDIFWQKESELGRFEKVAKIIFCNMQFYPTRTLCYEFLPSNEARKCNFITTQGWEEGISATQILKFEFPAKIFNFQTSPVRQCFRNHWISLARLNIAVWKLNHIEFNMCRSTLLTGIWS